MASNWNAKCKKCGREYEGTFISDWCDRTMKKLLLAFAAVAAVLFISSNLSYAQDINACCSKKDGALRVVTDESKCTQSEKFISWQDGSKADTYKFDISQWLTGGKDLQVRK